MERILVKIIKRGKKLGFILPKKVVKRLSIKAGDEIEFTIVRKHLLPYKIGKIKNSLKLRQTDWGNGTERASQGIDKVLY